MYAPYPENMMESIKKVEATRAQRMATEPRRLTADEKDALLQKFHHIFWIWCIHVLRPPYFSISLLL